MGADKPGTACYHDGLHLSLERLVEAHAAVITRAQLSIMGPTSGYADPHWADAQCRKMGTNAHRGNSRLCRNRRSRGNRRREKINLKRQYLLPFEFGLR